MGRMQRSTRRAAQRMSWQQRQTVREEAARLIQRQDDLRAEVRAHLRAI
jgi:hypothetical protein